MELEKQLEAVLFFKAKPVTVAQLQTLLEAEETALADALVSLQQTLQSRGIRVLISPNKEVQLVTAPECSELIDLLRKDELKRDIGSAGADTLSIVLYRGPISRADIDRVRGVNSSFILRNLLIRGVIVRSGTGANQDRHLYQATPLLLSHLGIEQKEQLPEYAEVANALDTFNNQAVAES